jgi:hypothetical protein
MVEYWSISDIINKLNIGSVNVGDKFYCHSRVTPEFENYFTITNISRSYVYWTITDIRNSRLNEHVTSNYHGKTKIDLFKNGIKEKRYIKL